MPTGAQTGTSNIDIHPIGMEKACRLFLQAFFLFFEVELSSGDSCGKDSVLSRFSSVKLTNLTFRLVYEVSLPKRDQTGKSKLVKRICMEELQESEFV